MKRTVKFMLVAMGVVAATILFAAAPAFAQCAMCKLSISGSPSAAKLSDSLNFAIFVLLIPPVVMFCGIFVAAYKFRKAPGQSANEERSVFKQVRLLISRALARLHRRKSERHASRGVTI